MYVETFLICDAAHLDEWGRLHVRGQYHALSAPGFPAKHDLTLVAAMEWDRGDHGRYNFDIELLGPDGGSTRFAVRGGTDVGRVPVDRPRARTTLVQPMEDVVFETPGEYRFQLRVKGRTVPGPRLFLLQADEGDPGA